MMYGVPFKAEHVTRMQLQAAQRQWAEAGLNMAQLQTLEGPYANTLMLEGVPLVCAGAIPIWDHRAHLWAFVSEDVTAKLFLKVQTFARMVIAGLPFKRLEAAVDVDFYPGHRWMRSLGFTLEAPRMKAYQWNGRACSLYALVR